MSAPYGGIYFSQAAGKNIEWVHDHVGLPRRKGEPKRRGRELDPVNEHKRGPPLLGEQLGVHLQRLWVVEL